MITLNHLSEAYRIFKRKIKTRKTKKYKGNAEQICNKIIQDCWNGSYFQTSSGHFSCFYIRDFGWCINSLLKLGYKDKVLKTLEYALSKYSKQKLTSTITPKGKCIDIFTYSPDSLAFLIRSLKLAKANNLIKKYKPFLIKEIKRFENIVINKKTNLVKTRKFSSIKDQAIRRSSTYNNIMAAMLAKDLKELKIKTNLNYNLIKTAIKKHLWNNTYFYDDLNKKNYIAADANIFPFWTNIFQEKEMLNSAIKSMQSANLEKPLPIKYTQKNIAKFNFARMFVKNYEGTSIWAHMGPLYIHLLKKTNKNLAKKHISSYTKLIEKYKNYLEVFNPDATPFKTPFYYSDEGMLWAANYLTLKK